MKNMINYILITITAGLMLSCNENATELIDPPTIKKEVFELIWVTSLHDSKEIVNLNNGQVYDDFYIYSGDKDDSLSLFGFDTTEGIRLWDFNNSSEVSDEIDKSFLFNSNYIGLTSKGLVSVNLDSKVLNWEIALSPIYFRTAKSSKVYNDNLYYPVEIGGVGLNSDAVAILKINLVNGEFTEIYRKENDSSGVKSISPPVVNFNSDGDEIIIFSERPNEDTSPPATIQDIVAYNVTKKVESWRTSNFSAFYASNGIHPPIIHNDIVITGGDWSIYAFDINTGQQLWRYQVPGYDQFGIWTTTNHLIHNDRLYVNPSGHPIICLNPIDGSVIWENLEDAPNCTDNMIYYEKEDYLVYTSWGLGSVMIIDALTGELVHRERSEDSTFNNDPVYDPETDMFFTSTYKHAIGFKINRPE